MAAKKADSEKASTTAKAVDTAAPVKAATTPAKEAALVKVEEMKLAEVKVKATAPAIVVTPIKTAPAKVVTPAKTGQARVVTPAKQASKQVVEEAKVVEPKKAAEKVVEKKVVEAKATEPKKAVESERTVEKVVEKKVVEEVKATEPTKVEVPEKVKETKEPVMKEVVVEKKVAPKKVVEKKATPRKAAAKKVEPCCDVFLVEGEPHNEAKTNIDNLVARAKESYAAQGHDVSAITSIQVYVKPEDQRVYYVINGVAGDVGLYD